MRTFFCSVLLLLSSTFAMASDEMQLRIPTPGNFQFQGTFQVLQVKRHEAVHAYSQDGRLRLEKLRKNGHECNHVERQIHLCTKFEPVERDARLEARIDELYRNSKVAIGELREPPAQETDGEIYKSWLVKQNLSIGRNTYTEYTYAIAQGKHKVVVGPNASKGFFLNPNGSISFPLHFSLTESTNVYRTYVVLGDFRRI